MHLLVLEDSGDERSKALDMLLKSKAKVNIQDSSGRTPIHYAAYLGSSKNIAMLLGSNPDLSLTDEKNLNPVQILIQNNSTKSVAKEIYNFNKDDIPKIAQIIKNVIKHGSGRFQDSKESWTMVNAIIDETPHAVDKVNLINETLKLVSNSSRKNRLISFLNIDEQKKLRAKSRISMVNAAKNFMGFSSNNNSVMKSVPKEKFTISRH